MMPQDVLTRGVATPVDLDPTGAPRRLWLCTVVANAASAYASPPTGSAEAAVPDVQQREADSDLAHGRRRCDCSAQRRQPEAVDLALYAGLSVAETAAVMGISSAGTVKSTWSDARVRLRETSGSSHADDDNLPQQQHADITVAGGPARAGEPTG